MTWRPACADKAVKVGDYPRYPGARLLLSCRLCGWSKDYSPERVIDRLRELRAGGRSTSIEEIARRVERTCPDCGRAHWAAVFAWPPSMGDAEIKRIANRYRN